MTKRLMAATVLICLMSVSSWAGFTFTSVSKHEGATPGQSKGPNMDMTSQAWFEGGQGRIEIIQGGDNPMIPKGGYMILKDAGKTLYMVNPGEKSYMKWDMEGMMGLAGGAMGMMNMKVSNPKVETVLDEAGPTILGCTTRHVKIQTSYTMSMSFMGMNNTSSITQEQELWTTEKFKDAGLDAWKNTQGMLKTGDQNLDALIKAQMEKVQGIPLKMIASTTNKDNSGKSHVNRTIMEVTEIKEMSVSKDKFEIPSGYTEKKMEDMIPSAMKQSLKGAKSGMSGGGQ